MEGAAVEQDGAVMALTSESPSSEEPISYSPVAEIDLWLAIAFPSEAEAIAADSDAPTSDSRIWVQSQTIRGQSNQDDDPNQAPLLAGNEYGGNDYGLRLDELRENAPDTFDGLLQGGYGRLAHQQNDFVQMNALQQIFPFESSLSSEQDYQILRVTVNEMTFSDRIEIGVTLTVTDSQSHQLSSTTTTPLLEPVPLLN
jgi:hypothetical protein